MLGSRHLGIMVGVLVAISLFATVSALAIQLVVGKSVVSIAIGPVIAAAAVLIFSQCPAVR